MDFKVVQTILILLNSSFAYQFKVYADDHNYENVKIDMIVEIINSKINTKGWSNVIIVGHLPEFFYKKTQHLHYTYVVAENEVEHDKEIGGTEKFLSNTLIIDCVDLIDFENKFNIARNVPYWHPHTHTIIYYHGEISKVNTAKLFFMLWYYQCCNAIMVQYKDADRQLIITHYSPYASKNYVLDYHFGCWTFKKITFPVGNFNESYVCTDGCKNITLHPLRTNFLGTCIGLGIRTVNYNDTKSLQGKNFFEDKAKNLNGFPLTAYASQLVPFLNINDNGNGTYTFSARDGIMYTEMSKAMNFTIDITPGLWERKAQFEFEFNIQRIYAFAQRKVDLIFTPIYQFDLVIVEVDLTVPFKESGVCFLSHLADYDTILFDMKLMKSNYKIFLNLILCFAGSWLTFFVFNAIEKNTITYDQIGKDLINTIRSILCIPLYKPPKRQTFRIFLLVAMWSFFLINFVTQAAIISFFSVYKRGENVETFEDIIEKGYKIEGFASPDVMLPETEERFKKINEKLVPIQDLYGCVKQMSNDSKRFCLIDCSVGRYYERNQLNSKGEPYLHIAKDQVHNHYLTMMLHKNSALTDQFNKYMLKFVEAGLIMKWEQYRYKDIKYEVPVKSLGMSDLAGIFQCFGILVGVTIVVFTTEILSGVTVKDATNGFKIKLKKTTTANIDQD